MVVIERIQKTDFRPWMKLRRQLSPDCPVDEHKREMEMWTDNPARFPVYGAFTDGLFAGVLEISIGDHEWLPGIPAVFYLEGFFVDPADRGRYHKMVVESSMTLARTQKFDAVFSDTQA